MVLKQLTVPLNLKEKKNRISRGRFDRRLSMTLPAVDYLLTWKELQIKTNPSVTKSESYHYYRQ